MKKKFILTLLVITLGALFIRLAVSWELSAWNQGYNAVHHAPTATDMATYRKLATQIVCGEFDGEFYYQPFYYVVFLPVLYAFTNCAVWAVIIAQCLLGALTVLLTGLCGAKIWNRRAGVLAAVAVALSESLILFTPFHLIATLQAFWVILLLWIVLKTLSAQGRRWWLYWGLAGFISGCGILTRGNLWFFVPCLVYAAATSTGIRLPKSASSRDRWWQITLVVGLLSATIFLPQLPFIQHNTRIRGVLSGPSTAAGAVLALGNTPEAPPGGRNPDLPAGPMEYPPTYGSWMANADRISIPTQIYRWFCREPVAWLELTFRKLLLFFDYREIPNNVSFMECRKQSVILRYLNFCTTGLIMMSALAGLIILLPHAWRRRRVKLLLSGGFIVAYWLATAVFYLLARFRAPIIPVMAVVGAVFIDYFLRSRKRDAVKAWFKLGPALLAGFFISFAAYDFYRYYCEAGVMRLVRPDGVRVALTSDTIMCLDNGPFSFGGWQFRQIIPGEVLSKKFVLGTTGAVESAELELTLVFENSGSATFEINGTRHIIRSQQSGLWVGKLPVAIGEEATIKIKLISANAEIYYVIDTQRHYRRSRLNQKDLGGELVCRLFVAEP